MATVPPKPMPTIDLLDWTLIRNALKHYIRSLSDLERLAGEPGGDAARGVHARSVGCMSTLQRVEETIDNL